MEKNEEIEEKGGELVFALALRLLCDKTPRVFQTRVSASVPPVIADQRKADAEFRSDA